MRTTSTPEPPVRRVALAFPTGVGHLQPLVRGIAEHARGRWRFTTALEAVTLSVTRLGGWRGDGVIADVRTPADRRAAAGLGLPVVTFAGTLADPGVPRVTLDNVAVGRLAADHLVACGFPRFGYYGLRGVRYARQRGAGFAGALLGHGRPRPSVHRARNVLAARALAREDAPQRLEAWLAALRPPVGVLAANDLRARMVLDACERLGLRVPEQVGVVGVDDDLVTCTLADPPLSSVRCDWHRVGVELAERLDTLMAGGRVVPWADDLYVAPLGITRRASTDVIVAEHPAVAEVVRYVRAHPDGRFGVKALLQEAAVSRRALELAFRRALGCTPAEFVARERVARAKLLLAREPRLKLAAVARQCGFGDVRRLRLVFERHEGVTPAAFRRAARAHTAAAAADPASGA